jgi:hypothetical protein
MSTFIDVSTGNAALFLVHAATGSRQSDGTFFALSGVVHVSFHVAVSNLASVGIELGITSKTVDERDGGTGGVFLAELQAGIEVGNAANCSGVCA